MSNYKTLLINSVPSKEYFSEIKFMSSKSEHFKEKRLAREDLSFWMLLILSLPSVNFYDSQFDFEYCNGLILRIFCKM